jgi:hypothetical protein
VTLSIIINTGLFTQTLAVVDRVAVRIVNDGAGGGVGNSWPKVVHRPINSKRLTTESGVKMTKNTSLYLIACLLCTSITAACTPVPASETSDGPVVEPASSEATPMPEPAYPLVDICDLSPDMVGQAIRVEGRITYLDMNDPEMIYFDVQYADCQAGVWLDRPAFDALSEDLQSLLVMDGDIAVSGTLEITDGENFLVFESLDEPLESSPVVLDPSEKWWLKPQTYHHGEGPDVDLIPEMNITVLHDWGTLTAGFGPDPDPYWHEEFVRDKWERAHAKGMRVEAVLSILDMWFVVYGPQDAVYQSSGIDLNGEHIAYEDPVGFVGCTNHHGWQEFTKERIFAAIDWGADGIIIDDYEGSSRWTSGVPNGMGGLENGPGACFCDACEAGFREYLREKYSSDELTKLGVEDLDTFDYSDYLLARGWTIDELGAESRKFQGWDSQVQINVPLYQDYADFQNLEIVNFLQDLKEEALEYAKEEYGREISWSTNAGELTYGAHKTYPGFDRNTGAIVQFGYPPKGTEGYQYRLGFATFGAPRLRFGFSDPIVVGVMNEYQTQNLWLIKSAEAYANQGALIEYDYIALEGSSDEVAHASLTNDAEAKNRYNTFYLDHSDIFDFSSHQSLANTAVLYSSPSVHFDMNRHIQSFNGICEILTDLNVQFDPLFIGDGISYPDALNMQDLAHYDLLFLPNVYSLTEHQAQTLLDYMQAGGSVVALGDFAIVDAYDQPFSNNDLLALLGHEDSSVGSGSFSHLRTEVFRADGVIEDYFKDIAAVYFERYIENNHPAVESILYAQFPEDQRTRITDETAAGIRNEILTKVDNALDNRIVHFISTENVAAQLYFQDDTQQVILHLLNYNYRLEADAVLAQQDLMMEIRLPEGFDVSSVSLLSPDLEEQEELDFLYENGLLELTVPHIYIWDVIVIE